MKKIFTLLFATLMAVNVMADDLSGKIDVAVTGATYSNENVTYTVTTYTGEDGTQKMDVVVPSFELVNTVMGNLTLGTYTVKGLVYDSEKGGYYRDYKNDGLSVHFKAVSSVGLVMFDKDYAFNSAKDNNILVKTDGNTVTSIVNHFQMGAMPYPISSTFTPNSTTGIESLETVSTGKMADGKMYNLSGAQVDESYKGLVIQNGRKFVKK